MIGTNDVPVASTTELVLIPGDEDSPYNITSSNLLFNVSDVDDDELVVKNLVLSEASAAYGNFVLLIPFL